MVSAVAGRWPAMPRRPHVNTSAARLRGTERRYTLSHQQTGSHGESAAVQQDRVWQRRIHTRANSTPGLYAEMQEELRWTQ